MKAPLKQKHSASALIIVLLSLALVMILLVGFLASVGTEFQSSKVYANESSLKLLAQSSVNLVIGQLRVATADASLCWASQPGMLRTYDTQGNADGYFKLYSDGSMQGKGAFDATATDNIVPEKWYEQGGVYVDLNEPVAVSGTKFYPILHGDPADYIPGTPLFDLGSGAQPVKMLKSATGNASDPSDVSGFWLRKDTPLNAASPNVAPMPVKWIYVLQDGNLAIPDTSPTGGVVSFTASPTKPETANPIIGRIAFWTDDETAKVNINTASEGAFWDTPRTYTNQDYFLAVNQPLQGEFQRYPGHPAQVSLSAVLGIQNPGAVWDPAPAYLSPPTSPVTNEAFYPITPATKAGGSLGGTVETTPGTSALPSSVTRLYTTLDEFQFQMQKASGVRQNNSALIPSHPNALAPETLRKSRFFLTANSQAPDVNVFNLPRVSMWPVTLDKATGNPAMTPYDKLISFCTTINSHIFYFQRKNPNSPTEDLPSQPGSTTGLGRNRQLLEYLRNLTELSFPGFGTGNFATKYADDRHQILTEMFDYIRSTNMRDSVTGAYPYTEVLAPAPESSSSGKSTYQAGKGQVLPIVDREISIPDPQNGGNPANPRGFGRFPTLQQAALVFIGVRNNSTTYIPNTSIAPGFPAYPDANFTPIAPTDTVTQRVQAAFVVQTFDPSQGPTSTYPWFEIEVRDLDKLEWSNSAGTTYPMQFPGLGVISKPFTVLQGTSIGGQNDFRLFTQYRSADDTNRGTSKYPFVAPPTGALSGPSNLSTSTPVTSPDMTGLIYFKGGTIKVDIYALKSDGTRDTSIPALQTFTLEFPAATFPSPTTIVDSSKWSFNTTPAGNNLKTNFRSFYSEGGNFGRFNIPLAFAMLGSNDSIRALVATPGDMRMVSPRTVVPKSFFAKLSNYDDQATPRSHMLRFGYNFPVYGSLGSKLVNVPYSRYQSPFNSNDTWWAGSAGASSPLPPNATAGQTSGNRMRDAAGAVSTTGVTGPNGVAADWDNGIANTIDGGYINKADEGDSGVPTGYKPYMEFDYSDGIPGNSFFSPNKMIPSSGILGSLPTGVWSFKPWQTLLFRPGPAGHAGLGTEKAASPAGTPPSPPFTVLPDYLLMDLFGMPVVEPYAISTPLATAGRINMNYQMIPFTYIHRDTGLRAAMKAQMITAIGLAANGTANYKNGINPVASGPGFGNATANLRIRFPLNADSTLSQFDAKFRTNNLFRAPSEICAVDLVPSGPTGVPTMPITRTAMDTFWNNTYKLTGDNVRERPYANLYPLLTTKSNTYTVHYRVQLLKPSPRGTATQWKEGVDQVVGQYRGSQIVERYIDPNDTLPDYATEAFPPTEPLSKFYKYRIVSTKQFAP